MPPKSPVTTLLFRFQQSTIFLPITSSSTLSSLTAELYDAIKATTDPDAGETPLDAFPQGPEDIALWKEVEQGEGVGWERVTDHKNAADKWGLREADTIGVSFKVDGEFPLPDITPPPAEEDEEQA